MPPPGFNRGREKFYLGRFAKVYAREMQKFRKFFVSRKFLLAKVSAPKVTRFGVLKWTLEELHHIDVKTRKLLTKRREIFIGMVMLTIYRKEGGRGIKNIEDSFNGRMIAITLHLLNND